MANPSGNHCVAGGRRQICCVCGEVSGNPLSEEAQRDEHGDDEPFPFISSMKTHVWRVSLLSRWIS